VRIFSAIGLVIALAQPGLAADKTPVTIGAFSSPALTSEDFYQDMGRRLDESGSFDVKLLVNGELGSDEAHFYALRRSRIDIAGVGFQSVSTMLPELAVINAAYLFSSWDEVDWVFETALTRYVDDLLLKQGIIGIRHYGAAWHSVYAKQPMRVPADLIGRRYRALIDPASQLFAQVLGVDLFQVASTEILTSLQTGLIDAGETNSHVYNITGTSEAAPFYTRTRHTPSIITLLASKRWWDRLTRDQQELVMASYPPMRAAGGALRADEERMLASADHVTLIEPNPPELELWRGAGQSTHGALIEQIGGNAQELYDLIMAAKAAYAADQEG